MITLVIVGCAVLASVAFIVSGQKSGTDDDPTVLLHKVERADFEAFVTEPGDVVSSSNVEVRCQVESRGGAGTSILKICDEGIHVKEGDFLVQLDDSVLQKELVAQKIVVANDKALLIQAKSDLANAERTLLEFNEGLFEQECEKLESAIYVAEEEVRKKDLELQSNRRLAARGLIKQLQLTAAEFAIQKARKDVAAATRALDVYKRFTKERLVGEYEAEIEKQKASVEAAEFTLELSNQRLCDIEEQIAHCYITAPAAGQVVHANERHRGEPQVMEEGAVVRYNQVVIRLPDIQEMQVDVKINESHINRIKVGQRARIELDADPDNPLQGEVKSVAPYPFPMRWHGSPLEYGVEIAVVDPPPTIRPGLRAKVRVYFESEPDVLQVPLAAVIAHNQLHYCLVREGDSWRVQCVEIGASNNSLIVVRDGLDEGERVSLTPFRFIQRSELPEPSPETVAARQQAKQQRASELTADVTATVATPGS